MSIDNSVPRSDSANKSPRVGLPVATIKQLLREAVDADWLRFTHIQVELGDATAAYDREDEAYEIDTPAAGLNFLLDHILVEYKEKYPRRLPELLPVIVAICGERDADSIAAGLPEESEL